MRSISIRQFQQHFHAELASLPFQVTKHGKPYFNVVTIGDVVTPKEEHVVTSKVIETPADVPSFQGSCEHGRGVGLCEFGCT